MIKQLIFLLLLSPQWNNSAGSITPKFFEFFLKKYLAWLWSKTIFVFDENLNLKKKLEKLKTLQAEFEILDRCPNLNSKCHDNYLELGIWPKLKLSNSMKSFMKYEPDPTLNWRIEIQTNLTWFLVRMNKADW